MTTEAVVSGVGLLFAALSMLGNGTFGIFAKLCKTEPDPILFNACLAVGILVSSLLTIPFFPLATGGDWPLALTWPGALSGALLVAATAASFVAISLSGLATAQATWSCAAILVSFLWGALAPSRGGKGPGAPVSNWGLTSLSVVLLVLGVLIINLAGPISSRLSRQQQQQGSAKAEPDDESQSVEESAPSESGNAGADKGGAAKAAADDGSWKLLAGILAALVVGVCGGSILVPSSFVPEEYTGLPLLLSLGLAAGVLGVLLFVFYWSCYLKESLSLKADSSLRRALRADVILYGILSGIFWNAGNICQIIAITYLHMPYGVSYPILQCALVVAGLWGIFFFKEVTRCGHIAVFFVGVGILVGGVVLLGLFGPGS